MQGIRVATFNVNGMSSAPKRRAIFQDLRQRSFDFCLLQETHSTQGTLKLWKQEWGGQIIASNGQQNARGVAIVVKRALQAKVIKQVSDQEGRIILIDVETQGTTYTLGSLYAPNQDKPAEQLRFLDKLEEFLDQMDSGNIILGGDFNCFLSPNLGRNTQTPLQNNANRYRSQILEMLETRILCDIWRIRHPVAKEYTFRRGKYASRLDYLFISSQISEAVAHVKIHHVPHSDHSILALNLGTPVTNKGPGLWRFDVHLLNDKKFNTEMETFLSSWQPPEELSDPSVVWEWMKFAIKGFVIGYQKREKSASAQITNDLRRELQSLGENQDSDNEEERDNILLRIELIKRELKEIEEEAANKIIFRSRCRWARLGEKPTKYFLNLEKQRSKNNTLSTILTQQGHEVSDQKLILEECRAFYEKLYTKDSNNLHSHDHIIQATRHLQHPVLTDISRQQLDQPISKDELKVALGKLNKGKSPGTDGLPPEYYTAFWDLLSPFLYESLTYSLQEGRLSTGQRRGVITLIPKKDVDRRRVANWRPNTLLNCDYKILTKTVALRLQRHIPPLIHSDQTGFMQTRCIGDNIRIIDDAINMICTKESEGLILALDFSKAFDSVRWEMICIALDFFNFGPNFIDLIKTLFVDIESSIINAGSTSKSFKPTRGIRQGCCASPYLFNLVMEMLAIMIRSNENVKGIQMHNTEIKLTQFADDLTCLLNNPTSVEPLLDTLNEFAKWSGLKINVEKSQAIYPPGLAAVIEKVGDIPVRKEAKILGIWTFSQPNPERSYEKNFQPILEKARQVTGSWVNRSLSIKGKVTVINSLITSLFQYPCSYIHTPPRVFKEYQKIITAFLWDGRKPKVAYLTLTLPVSQGGLGLGDLETRTQAALLQGIRRLIHQPRLGSAAYLRDILKSNDLKEYFRCRPAKIPKAITTSPIYTSMFKL